MSSKGRTAVDTTAGIEGTDVEGIDGGNDGDFAYCKECPATIDGTKGGG